MLGLVARRRGVVSANRVVLAIELDQFSKNFFGFGISGRLRPPATSGKLVDFLLESHPLE